MSNPKRSGHGIHDHSNLWLSDAKRLGEPAPALQRVAEFLVAGGVVGAG